MKEKLIVLLAVVGGSLAGAFVRFADAPAAVLVVWRMALSVLILLPGLWRDRVQFSAMTKKVWLLCAVSGASLGLSFVTFFEAVKYTSLSACAVLVNMEVLFVALITVAVFRQRLGGKKWAAILLAFGGAVVIALADGASGGGSNALLGDALATLSAVLAAVYTVSGSICRKSLGTTVYTCLIYFFAMLAAAVPVIAGGTPLLGYGVVNYLVVLGLVVFCTFLSHSLFSWSLKYLPPAFISTMKLLDPLCATLWALVLFREVPGGLVLLGGVIVIAGVLLYSRAVPAAQKTEAGE